MLLLTKRTRTEKRRKEDALMARSRTGTSRKYSLLKDPYDDEPKEPYDDELKDPLRDPDKAFVKLEEGKYRAELELVDRYQSFVAELLRLSLAGIAVFGFLYKITFEAGATIGVAKVPAALGILAFGISAASALVFRFFAAEGARFYIEALRFNPPNADSAQKKRARESLEIRDEKVRFCRLSKEIAALALAVGGALEAIAVCLLLITYL
jgi:hypothetical protein